MTEEQKRALQQALWGIANELRGKMDADEFRDYILGFIFYKYLSERLHLYANDILEPDGIEYTEIREGTEEGQELLDAVRTEAVEELGYFLKPSELFASLAARGARKGDNFILDDLVRILENIQKSTMGSDSEEDFNHLFEDMDLGSTKLGRAVSDRNELVAKVLGRLDQLDFHLHEVSSDLLGDAYEYLIGKFASGAGKKAGEFYTPQQVSTILARIVTTGRDRLQNVYDPACGSGSLLLRVAREVGLGKVGGFYGQELNRTTYNLARMNMILHGVHYRRFDLKQEDTLERPQHDGKFEAVVANPPFSANWSADPHFATDDRFSTFGRLAPASKADFAFVLHMIHHLADNGTMAVILPHGVLFRGGAEGEIRKILIAERNYLDAVIGLPANIFYGTSIPTCVLVFKKCRENPGEILFIDASAQFEKVKNQNILRDEDVERIILTYRDRTVTEGYSNIVQMSDIKENDFNLNVPRYVDTYPKERHVNVRVVQEKLRAANLRLSDIDRKIAMFCTELGIETPVGVNVPLLRLYKTGIIQALFSRSLRFRGASSSFPDWDHLPLAGVRDKTDRNSFTGGPFGSDLKQEHYRDDGVMVIQLQNIGDGDFIWTAGKDTFTSERDADRLRSSNIFPGDIIISKMGDPVARSAFIPDRYDRYVMCSDGIRLKVDEKRFSPRFIYYAINTHKFRKEAVAKSIGSTRKRVSLGDLRAIEIPIPILEEQKKIAGLLSAIDAKIVNIGGKATNEDPQMTVALEDIGIGD